MDGIDRNKNGAETPPSGDELLAMAYADGELSSEATSEFESRLRTEPALAHLVAEHRALEVLSRRVAPLEPADHEWNRLREDPVFKTSVGLGWSLVVAGAAISFVLAVWGVATNDSLPVWGRALILASLAGFVLLFLSVLWRRLRTYPLDPYRHVER
ncbi:MAG: hypothetical protein AAF957_11350 [Planctomycetota bacterium]